jgi:thiol-disulfide isomerase/thioredoxin
MKKISLIALGLFANLCLAQPINNAKVGVEFNTKRSDNITIFSTMYDENETKTFSKINEVFFETEIKVSKPDIYIIRNGMVGNPDVFEMSIYLEPGYDLKIKIDEKNTATPLAITGKGAKENQILINRLKCFNYIKNKLLKSLLEKNTKEAIAIEAIQLEYDKIVKTPEYESCSATFKDIFQSQIEFNVEYFSSSYVAELKLKADQKNKIKVTFEYENSKKEKVNLASFNGKNLYIDLWATTCGPCILQFPSLEKLKEKYKGKNIEFISISLDQDEKKWTDFIVKHKLSGINLRCPNDKDEFMTKINLNGIPRMLLIDTQGNIVDFNAKLPSSPELIKDIDQLLTIK